MLKLIPPMMATLGTLPDADDDSKYGYEMKWDGIRAVAYIERGRVRLISRNQLDITNSYPELTAMGNSLPEMILDGEIVAFDPAGRPSFAKLQPRMHLQNQFRIRELQKQIPVNYLIFDLLGLEGEELLSRTYRQRRQKLEALHLSGPHWDTPPYFSGQGASALQTSIETGLEGVVVKRLDSQYSPGRRSTDWIKVKNLLTQEVVIGGWQPGEGQRLGEIGALFLGIQAEEGLRYIGQVGTGFTQAMIVDLGKRLRPLLIDHNPFATPISAREQRDACWVRPELVGEVVFSGWSNDGRLRQASWRGLRIDKPAEQVIRET